MDKKNKPKGTTAYILTRETFGMTILLFSALVLLMLVTGDLVFVGIGKSVCNLMYGTFGYGSFIVVALFVYLGVWLTFEKAIKVPWRTLLTSIAALFVLFLLAHSITTSGYELNDFASYISACYTNAANGFAGYTAGGIICGLIVYPIAKATTFVGCYLVFSILAVLCGYLCYMAIRHDYFSDVAVATKVEVKQEAQEEVVDVAEEQKPQSVIVAQNETTQDAKSSTEKDKFSAENLGRQILFANDEFAAESYRRNMIFNSDSYFNNPVHNEGDYLRAFGDNNQVPQSGSYTDLYANDKSNYTPASSYVSDDKPVNSFDSSVGNSTSTYENYNDDAPINSFSQPTYDDIEEIIGDSEPVKTFDDVVEPEEIIAPQDTIQFSSVEEPESIEGNYTEQQESDANKVEEIKEESPPQSFSPFGSIFSASNTRVGNSVQPDVSRLSSRRGQSNVNIFDDDGEKSIFGDDIAPLGAGFSETQQDIDRASRFRQSAPIVPEVPSSTANVSEIASNVSEEDARRDAQVVHITPPTKAMVDEANAIQVEKPKHVWKKYVRPTMDLLDDYPETNNVNTGEIEDNKRIIIETLETFKIRSQINNIIVGPAVTRYDVIIEDKTQIKNALKYKDTVAISLMKENVNAYLNYSKGAISIEVPNVKRTIVGLKTILASSSFINAKPEQLAFALGKNIEGEVICPDITKMPHLLVAGTTGSGKSICLSSLLISLLYKYGPEDLRFILVDPKQVEFVSYDKLPHLMINDIIFEVDKAIKALNWAIKEMERRYQLFKEKTEAGMATKNIDEYNDNLVEGEDKLPKIVIVLDEFGDLMLQAKKDIETRIIRLVQKARACGIHLILATQRPSVDCITGLIKSNLPTRIGFKVNSFDDARTIFDVGGAEKLLGMGDMYFRSASKPDLARIQGCFVGSAEVQRVTDFIKQNNETYFDQEVSDFINKVEEPEPTGADDEPMDADTKIDEVFIKALKKCVFSNAGTASVSMIQRYFPVGYIKACKIIDWMDNMNYVTESEGSKPRKVLLSREEFLNIYGEVDD